MNLGGLAFLNPALLAGLVALPLIWWLLRAVPPAPKRVNFPATRILVGLENQDKQPVRTPWWLTALRMLAAALLIFALAEPVLNPSRQAALTGTGPVVLVVDNGWASGALWSKLVAEAEGQSRSIIIVPTAPASKSNVVRNEAPIQARSTIAALQPQPFAPDRMQTLTALEPLLANAQGASLVWLADGIDHDGKAAVFSERLAALIKGGSMSVVETAAGQEAIGLTAGLGQGGRLETDVIRTGGAARALAVHAVSGRGQRLAETVVSFAPGDTRASAKIDIPLELRNQVARIEVAGERAAGSVHLLDARARWHRIGILSGASREQAQPLLAPLYYIERALQPFAELAKTDDSNLQSAIEGLIKRNVSVLVLADIGTLSGELKERVEAWVKKGGVLVRFSGPRLEKGGDDLIPAPLRLGGRALGGALSWSTPQPLAPFAPDSLFAGLTVPPDVLVTRQVLADPARIGEDVKSWARLKDGTPLVTSAKRGDGQIVLFHVTANSDWSNVPLSGLFVDMLRRIATLGKAGGVSGGAGDTTVAANEASSVDLSEVLPPLQTLDGFGLLKPPPPTAQTLNANAVNETRVSLDHPPGYYGPQGSPRALNLVSPKMTLAALPSLPATFARRGYQGSTARPLKPGLLGTALALLFADIVATLALGGAFAGMASSVMRRSGKAAITVFAVGALTMASDTQAQAPSSQPTPNQPAPNQATRTQAPPPNAAAAMRSTGKVTFAYVATGDAAADRVSQQGLQGLMSFLKAKTSVEPGEPVSVNIATDEVAFFPMLYWPVLPNARQLDNKTLAKIDAYMKEGGMIVFDTRDSGTSFGLPGQGGALQRLLGDLDLPRLEPVPEAHVLTKSFYLLRTFPGRYDAGQLWVEAEAPSDSGQGRQARRVDGVSSILVTSNDFASAWAMDQRGQSLYPVVPGGERQREYAFRTGVNIVMYALTGNYKADQVHIPAILERLGQ
jgi:Domain of unknown function (DUF4159)/Aerotolerance regulator N-terminal